MSPQAAFGTIIRRRVIGGTEMKLPVVAQLRAVHVYNPRMIPPQFFVPPLFRPPPRAPSRPCQT